MEGRNVKCLEVRAGRKKLGIIYGAAHFPDMEQRRVAGGWTKTGEEGMTAWDIAQAK